MFHFILTLPCLESRGFFLQPGGSPISLTTERWRPSVQKRSQDVRPVGSRVPHPTVRNGVLADERDDQAVRPACAPRRDSPPSLSLAWSTRSCFSLGYAHPRTHSHDSVVKVLEHVDYKECGMSSDRAWEAGSPPVGGRLFIPCARQDRGFQACSL